MARITKDSMVRMTEILDAAEELFYARGYHETAISDIVKSIGVAQGTFYYYFKSKDEILEALINRRISEFSHTLEQISASSTLNPLEKLEKIIQTLKEHATEIEKKYLSLAEQVEQQSHRD